MSRFAAFRQRPPLHNRLAPQRPNGHAVSNEGLAENAMGNSTGARPPAAHQRLRPVRPVARHGSATMYRPTPPMALSGSATGSLVKPGSASAPCSIEPLHVSSGNTNVAAAGKPCSEGNSPTATVFESIEVATAVEPKSDSSAPITSQHASRKNSPTLLTDQPIETGCRRGYRGLSHWC
ncbi:hypothetical protein DL89DRAFT_111729 [Linderina pennispora]|uniref:Uncharacterized protein n=1 Tax=Linderina pennispora TaxID=61395 RepID=A0A1Y1WGF0_9FUNG|nr:uncharacterized protein DL89DRAFT_111729 [Linderina pennispora]ORX72306.1 hypothetical protein DL89DRAFT_111729 [Linderina pennispora]